MKLTLRYNLHGGDPIEVTTNLANVVAWERRFKRKASDMATGAGVEDLLFLAFEASKTSRVVVPAAFDDFVAKVENLDVIQQEQPNPTPAAPGDGS